MVINIFFITTTQKVRKTIKNDVFPDFFHIFVNVLSELGPASKDGLLAINSVK